MKIIFTLSLIAASVTASAQTMNAPGRFSREIGSFAFGSDTLRPGMKFVYDTKKGDSITIKRIEERKYRDAAAVFAVSKGGYYYQLQEGGSAWHELLNKDTITTSTGFKIGAGQYLKLGTGAMNDGDFRYIRINEASMFHYYTTTDAKLIANSANAAPSKYSGMIAKVIRVEHRRINKNTVSNYAIINDPQYAIPGMIRFEIDVENAIKAGELDVPDQYRPQNKNATTIVQPLSTADEILKLKKLKDEGILTEDEYIQQKKKLLDK